MEGSGKVEISEVIDNEFAIVSCEVIGNDDTPLRLVVIVVSQAAPTTLRIVIPSISLTSCH